MARGLSPTRTETLVMPRTEEDRLWQAGGACSVEGHIAFNLLHDLMDMAVEHSHRAKALQHVERPLVVGAPSPIGIDRPERDVREHDDRRRVRLVLLAGAWFVVRRPG